MFTSRSSKFGGVQDLLSCSDGFCSFNSSLSISMFPMLVASVASFSSFDCSAPIDDLVVELFLLSAALSRCDISSVEVEFLVNAFLVLEDSKKRIKKKYI
jgi:hypothetical protein